MNTAEMLENGYVHIEFCSPRIERVIDGFKLLLAQPEAYRDAWLYDLGFDPDPDDGLVPKRHKHGKDQKWYFHYRPWLVPLLRERVRNRPSWWRWMLWRAGWALGLANAPPVPYDFNIDQFEDWLNDLHDLYNECLAAVTEACKELEDELGCDLVLRTVTSPFHVLRLLWYEGPHAGTNVIGKLHTDKAAFTIAVSENRPGLELDGALMPAEEGRAVFFAGDKAEYLTEGCLRAVPHRAVLTAGDGANRWAVVFFAHLNINSGLVQFSGRTAAAE